VSLTARDSACPAGLCHAMSQASMIPIGNARTLRLRNRLILQMRDLAVCRRWCRRDRRPWFALRRIREIPEAMPKC
jgi:hypothetical protein